MNIIKNTYVHKWQKKKEKKGDKNYIEKTFTIFQNDGKENVLRFSVRAESEGEVLSGGLVGISVLLWFSPGPFNGII